MGALKEELDSLRGEELRREEALNYMSDMKNWVCVHVTKYEPKKNEDGELYLETTAMATGYKYPRASNHFVLNDVVANNSGGNWDAADIVVLAPFNDVVRKNGNPQEVAVEDTYFIPDPDKGLVLPENTVIIKPDPNCKNWMEVQGNVITYKTDNYTKEEIEDILSFNEWDKSKYERYQNGDIPEYDVDRLLGYDKKLKKLYEDAKDKKAFMRGIMEEDKFLILKYLLRDEVMKVALKKMGYEYVIAHEDNTTRKVADIAEAANIQGDSGNKGHSNSVEYELEIRGCALVNLSEKLKSKDYAAISEYLTEFERPMSNDVIANITSDTPLPDIQKGFEKVFDDHVERLKNRIECYDEDTCPQIRANLEKRLTQLGTGGIKGYNPRLDTVVHRHSRRMTVELNQALKELRQNPEEFAALKQCLIEHSKGEKSVEEFWDEHFNHRKSGLESQNGDFLSIFAESKKNKR